MKPEPLWFHPNCRPRLPYSSQWSQDCATRPTRISSKLQYIPLRLLIASASSTFVTPLSNFKKIVQIHFKIYQHGVKKNSQFKKKSIEAKKIANNKPLSGKNRIWIFWWQNLFSKSQKSVLRKQLNGPKKF